MINIIYMAAVLITFAHGDHNRYRDSVSGHYLILLAMLITSLPIRKIAKTEIAQLIFSLHEPDAPRSQYYHLQ